MARDDVRLARVRERMAAGGIAVEVPPERPAELLAEVKRRGTTMRSLGPYDAFGRLAWKLARSAPPAESKR